MHTCNRYTSYVIREHKVELVRHMICNIAVNQQGTSGMKNMISNNPTPATPEDATSGKTNICKNYK